MIAGPSEILVVSDGKTDPKFTAADLLSQAEHDKMASAVLVTDSMDFALKVQKEIESQLDLLERKDIIKLIYLSTRSEWGNACGIASCKNTEKASIRVLLYCAFNPLAEIAITNDAYIYHFQFLFPKNNVDIFYR
jgi:histidinol dehydrogenase